MDNNLNSEDSPQRHGVRRLNHVPILIICSVLSLAGVMIIMVAVDKKAKQQEVATDHGGGTDSYANQITDGKTGYTKPAPTPTPAGSIVASTPFPTPDTTETEARKKAFYSALFSSSSVSDLSIVQQPADPMPTVVPTPEMPAFVPPAYPTPEPTPKRNSLSMFDGNKDRWNLNTQLEKPVTPFILRTGWVIPALMLTAVESQLPGTITAQVSQDVFDTPTGKHLLIPQGSRIVGEYSNSIEYGQSLLYMAWQRIIYPDGSALDIGAMPGVDEAGKAGAHDRVNNHFLRIFGSALLMSVITAGTTLSQPQSNFNSAPNAESSLSSALGQQLGQASSSLLEKNLNIAPTLQIRPGYRFNIMVVKDLTFERPYHVPNY